MPTRTYAHDMNVANSVSIFYLWAERCRTAPPVASPSGEPGPAAVWSVHCYTCWRCLWQRHMAPVKNGVHEARQKQQQSFIATLSHSPKSCGSGVDSTAHSCLAVVAASRVELHTWTVLTGEPLLLFVPKLVLGSLFRTLHAGVLVDGWLAVVAEPATVESSLAEDEAAAAAGLHMAAAPLSTSSS